MNDKRIERTIFIKDEKWTEENDVDPLHEEPRLAFDLTQNFSDFDPKEVGHRIAALVEELPRKTVLIEEVYDEANLDGDPEGGAYSRPLILASISDQLTDAYKAIESIPTEHRSAVEHALDCAFSAGRDYQEIEFRKQHFNAIRQTVQRNNHPKSELSKARAEHNQKKKENADKWRQIAVAKIEEIGRTDFFEKKLRKAQAGIIRDTLNKHGFDPKDGTISNWLNEYERERK